MCFVLVHFAHHSSPERFSLGNVVVDEQNFIIRLLGFTPRRSLIFNFTRELYNRYS